ncbi:hypothetical protein [Psychrobacillus antarcticus]|uniref:hypothetical protein n=1 Tax=Psychrobacillus antarcticus TaxID=2879115 RepID=UPI0024083657|nr:hypothetical protein [Psychrobacillus antarcticus]
MNNSLNLQLDHQKSMILFTITAEAKKMKIMAQDFLKKSKGQVPTTQRAILKSQVSTLITGANKILKESRKMHFKGATVDLIEYLEEVLQEVKNERKGLESMMKLLK